MRVVPFLLAAITASAQVREADIVIYGATSAGIAAAVEASRMGKSVLVAGPGTHIGGLTTGGLSWTDIGNKQVIGGVAREFYQRIKRKYDPPGAWKHESREDYYTKRRGSNIAGEDAMWTFEPKVASQVYREMLAEHKIQIALGQRLDARPGKGVRKQGERITAIVMENGREYRGRMFIDATYEGDLLARAGVRYTIGREPNSRYGENYNGVQAAHRHLHQFPDGLRISPFVKPGDPASGVLPGIDPNGPGEDGAGDQRIQTYCFRLCMSSAPANRLPVTKPAGYDEREYELLLRYAESGRYHEPPRKWDPIPNAKTDTNNHGAVSTDFIGMNHEYPEGDYAVRERIIRHHETFTKGYLWTLQNHPRVPAAIREWYRQWGWPKDEFTNNGHFPTQLYIREARRMISDVVMTENHIVGKQVAADSVGMGAYGMDSHNVQRYITREGYVRNEGNVQVGGFQPYPISYRSIVPAKGQTENLFAPVCLSASHIAYGSIRMEPVFMVLGQSAATAASIAIDQSIPVQSVDYGKLRERLRQDKQVLELPESPRRAPRASIAPRKLEGIVIDEDRGRKTGSWSLSRATPPFLGAGYLHDHAARDGKSSIEFRVEAPAAGSYRIRVLYPPHENRASNVLVTINGGPQVRINQKREPEWLGPYSLPSAFPVVLSNQGADGFVVIDGLQVVSTNQ